MKTLGKSSVLISRVGMGTFSWGDPDSGYGQGYSKEGLQEAFKIARKAGINFFDTAEVYGAQSRRVGESSEQLLGSFAAVEREDGGMPGPPPVVATKFTTVPWTSLFTGGGLKLSRKSLVHALQASCKRLGVNAVDLYQIQLPAATFSKTLAAEALHEAYDRGLAKAVGVSNYNQWQMTEMHRLLALKGVPLASNQVDYSIFNRTAEAGLLQTCRELGVTLIAYRPLGGGGQSLRRTGQADTQEQLVRLMEFVGAINGGKSVGQVALAYVMAKGAVPIPGCKNVQQVRELAELMDWSLDADEVATFDEKLEFWGL
eukprot:jgi/Mesvir1/3676/Mv14965-RA.1